MNMKGGVGKTTISMNVAGALGYFLYTNKPRRILAIDYDPQFNLSQAFIPSAKYFPLEKSRKTVLSVLVDDDTDLDPFDIQLPGNHTPPAISTLSYGIYSHSANKGELDLIPSTLDLMYVALGQAELKTKPMEERFDKFIAEARTQYDLIFIDCHPAGSIFTKTSLRNSDHVLIPVVPDSSYAVRGIGLMLDFISAKKVGGGNPTPHILFNSTSRVGVSSEENTIRASKTFGGLCMKATLKRYKAFREPEGGAGFVWKSKKPYSKAAAGNLHQVVNEFIGRIGA